MRLKLCTHIASEQGLSSVTTLIVGTKTAVLINPPLLLQDGQSVIAFIRSKTTNPVTAIFVSHYHPDHYFAADLILEAFPTARLLAAPYVVAAINRQHDDQMNYWLKVLGPNNVTPTPSKPQPYNFSFFVLPGDLTSPIALIGPVQGSCPDTTLFWLPTERTLITGDTVFARSTHVLVEEVDNPVSLAAWRLTLDLIYSLDPVTIVTGHVEKGTHFDARRDMEHMYRYLDLFEDKVIRPLAEGGSKPAAEDLARIFQEAFPACRTNLDFFVERMASRFGEGAQLPQNSQSQSYTKQELEGFVMDGNT